MQARQAGLSDDVDYLRVNIPHYTLTWVEQGTRVWSMRTQVGKRNRQTPVFKSAINAIMANPTWTVPPTIFREDILPQLQFDPDYLDGQGMYVVDQQGRPVDSSGIDWRQTTAEEFPFRLRARPGNNNALGKMKFLVPNPHLIYLHDTPAKHLFAQTNRAVSSGCIRVENPEQLAEFLVMRQSHHSRDRLEAAMNTDATRFIGLDQPVPIVVTYATIDLDDAGRLVFARDIYGKDAKVLAALDAPQTNSQKLLVAGLTPEPEAAAR